VITDPTIIERPAQPYAGIRVTCPMRAIGRQAPPLIGEVFGWLGQRGIEPAGAPFFRYDVINMEADMQLTVGIPVTTAVDGDDRVEGGTLPDGRFATLTHTGSVRGKGLFNATVALLEWAAANDVKWDRHDTAGGDAWACRLESYETNPDEEPDTSKWETVLAFKLAD
jgi:effector-binding domain-containing protein